MNSFDPAGQEFLRISERYRQMSDGELLVLIPQSSELTPFAQEALANEVRSRGLKAEVEEQPSSPSEFRASSFKPAAFVEHQSERESEHESPKFRDSAASGLSGPDSSEEDQYGEDRKLVELCIVWSVRDALKVQTILDEAGIPFFMGPEKATAVDRVTSNFSKGVGVEIMQIGLPWARPVMQHYEPEDDPTPKEKTQELDELVVRCPNCHSAEVVFEGGTSTLVVPTDDPSQKYKWICDSCGHQWEDDGVANEE